MKKLLNGALLALLLHTAALAQISIIPKVGITGATQARPDFTLTDDEGNTGTLRSGSVSGFQVGVGVNFPFSERSHFSFQPELLYIQKGIKDEYAIGGQTIENKEWHNYLEIPLLLRASFGNKVRFLVNAGPSIGYAMGGSYRRTGQGNEQEGKVVFGDQPANYNGDDLYYSSEEVNRLDLGVQVGTGIGISAGPGFLQLEARLGIGLNHFLKTPDSLPTGVDADFYNSRNVALALSVGYAIPLGR